MVPEERNMYEGCPNNTYLNSCCRLERTLCIAFMPARVMPSQQETLRVVIPSGFLPSPAKRTAKSNLGGWRGHTVRRGFPHGTNGIWGVAQHVSLFLYPEESSLSK